MTCRVLVFEKVHLTSTHLLSLQNLYKLLDTGAFRWEVSLIGKWNLTYTHTHTHTRLTALCPGLPG